MSDSEILDWIEGHPHYGIERGLWRPAATRWAVYDGPVPNERIPNERTNVLARAPTLREAISMVAVGGMV